MGCSGALLVTLPRVLGVLLLLSTLGRTAATSPTLEELAENYAENLRENLGDEMKWLEELSDLTKFSHLEAKSRQKRIIPIELPRGMNFQLKWQLDFTINTFARFGMNLQLAMVNDLRYPREFVAMQEKYPLVDLIPEEFKPFVPRPQLLDKDELFGEENEEEAEVEDEKRRRYQILDRKKREASRDREILYNVLENYISEYGMPARPCLLRTICELAEVPLQDHLFGQLVTAVFSPSRGSTGPTGEAYDEYLAAEEHGLRRGNCAVHYGDCPASMFDVLPFMEHSFVY